MAEGHELARQQLKEIVEESGETIELLDETKSPNGTYLTFKVSLPFQGIDRVSTGLHPRARETFLLKTHSDFPFEKPCVWVEHRRFAGHAHVQFARSLCLYQSEADWKPEQGMYGLVSRLDGWIRDAALDQLDPDDLPLHPPATYPRADRLVVPVADAPATEATWFGYAALRARGKRTEIIGWEPLEGDAPEAFAPAVLLSKPLPFELPHTVHSLTNELEEQGVEYAPLMFLLARLALKSEIGSPLLVVLGTPMRRVDPHGPLLPHLVAWEIEPKAADALRMLNLLGDSDERFEAMGEDAKKKVAKWSVGADVRWCLVREALPAVTKRRDQGAATTWFRDKTVEIWGCGAIGSHVAESVARAGAKRLILTDNARVVPGILVRQLFDDEDVGETKAGALAKRIWRISPDMEVVPQFRDLSDLFNDTPIFQNNADVVLDCTGSGNLRAKLERRLRGTKRDLPIASLAVGYNAQSAIATLSLPEHSGGPADLIRRLKLAACRRPEMSDLVEDFWPSTPRTERFQPEPGCSEPTFVGSAADISTLSGRMLNAIAEELSESPAPSRGTGWVFAATGPLHAFRWDAEVVIGAAGDSYEVRLAPEAQREMRAWARTSQRRYGPKPETGGLLFGEANEAIGVIWVSEVEGPPPDSSASPEHFTCGVAGMAEANEAKQRRYRNSVGCVGTWHTHPSSPAEPSPVDLRAVAEILASPTSRRRTCLLLILGGDPEAPNIGGYAFRTRELTDVSLDMELMTKAMVPLGAETQRDRNIGLALSGGGSRAIAFHLGCFRALHDLGLLGRLQVISSVSGGSVLAAMYAYSSDSFSDFEERVVDLLRRGLAGDALRGLARPSSIVKTAANIGTVGVVSLLRTAARLLPSRFRIGLLDKGTPPPRRWYSRAEAFRDVLAGKLFGERKVGEVARDLDVVINATELRTGSAFRFGSQQSGCWRFGVIPDEDALVADAVAASAAYPVFLPALDRTYSFELGKKTYTSRVLLTDGGVFENLGVAPMEPGRTASISTNVFDPDFIISCDAGSGLFDDSSFPMWWPTRMIRAFHTTFRKVQDATRKRLHQLSSSRELSGFVLSYLGQQDEKLPWQPADLPRREDVNSYPTDFFAMREDDLEQLSLRGELLTRLLVAHHLRDL